MCPIWGTWSGACWVPTCLPGTAGWRDIRWGNFWKANSWRNEVVFLFYFLDLSSKNWKELNLSVRKPSYSRLSFYWFSRKNHHFSDPVHLWYGWIRYGYRDEGMVFLKDCSQKREANRIPLNWYNLLFIWIVIFQIIPFSGPPRRRHAQGSLRQVSRDPQGHLRVV